MSRLAALLGIAKKLRTVSNKGSQFLAVAGFSTIFQLLAVPKDPNRPNPKKVDLPQVIELTGLLVRIQRRGTIMDSNCSRCPKLRQSGPSDRQLRRKLTVSWLHNGQSLLRNETFQEAGSLWEGQTFPEVCA
jgi:hypothetical protein